MTFRLAALAFIAILAASSASAADDAAPITTHARPASKLCPDPAYPAESSGAREAGSVTLKLFISAEGLVEQTRVETSSGFQRLDAAAVAAVVRCRFVPAHSDGVPTAAWVQLRINYIMEGEDSEPLKTVAAVLQMRKYVDAVMPWCQSVAPTGEQPAFESIRQAWHARNDAVLHQAEQLKQDYYAGIRSGAQGQSPSAAVARSEASLESDIGRTTAREMAQLSRLSEIQQRDRCQRYQATIASGDFDIAHRLPEQYHYLSSAIQQLVP
ncbi:MAG: energy transducer TonB [Hydrocarboniphaga sp.]|uniref:energy transducer TonB n=1 Tax=Hydrocarboniphaga sp. TaxID=2033016 RepID=UPI002605AA89|nr:energy transducer TonB [Hydrocarboniphaga sp.]MDB5972330.1 energy transducer TonB [Hydrocarboniphaga sp.]